jgi:hypothetical protein
MTNARGTAQADGQTRAERAQSAYLANSATRHCLAQAIASLASSKRESSVHD